MYPPNHNRISSGLETSLPHLLRTPSGLAIVEIQGTVNAAAHSDDAQSLAVPVGRLVFPHYHESKPANDTSWQKRVYLYVGKHQRLTGEVKKLANPIAVIRRRSSLESAPERDELEIAEIIYYKLIFAHRPEPVGASSGE